MAILNLRGNLFKLTVSVLRKDDVLPFVAGDDALSKLFNLPSAVFATSLPDILRDDLWVFVGRSQAGLPPRRS